MGVYFKRRISHTKQNAIKESKKNKQKYFCPYCGNKTESTEEYNDRTIFKCSKCLKTSCINKNFNESKQQKQQSSLIMIRDKSQDKKDQKILAENKYSQDLSTKNKDITQQINVIKQSMEEKRLLSFTYINRNGKQYKTVEPYKLLKNNKNEVILYGQCTEKNEIRMYKVSNISNLNILEYEYKPKWDIENQLNNEDK